MKFDNKLNILVAFPYFSDSMIKAFLDDWKPEEYRLLVDSGAFSAYNAGMDITMDDYCNFLKKLEKSGVVVDNYVQLDKVYDGEQTQKNYIEMLERGFDPAPVFQRGDEEEYFHKLLNDDKYLFVGGVQKGVNNRNFAKWVLENSKGKKVHLLAFIKPDFINHYKPYSVDASSWSATSRFGRMSYYYKGRIKLLDKQIFTSPPPKSFMDSCLKLKIPMHAIKKLRLNGSWNSFDATDFSVEKDVPVKGLAQFISLIHWVYYSIQAQNKIGTKIYLAVGQPQHLKIFKCAYDHLKRNKLI